ncbi:hypothetical protein TTHERM_00138230 (macronuclear) [Tetrahymena thermophila SB210]|uniref:Transmembrane protein n=1 Tax=Tetrahymena thermophila (strain SB210) TaxID=312017 RepID=I7M8S2_TETTS|nr:hypothetical protein TTHERM_00138230 [Tetrahymena thermophila SB210]EAR99560.1 hypothetical protein TTHERM_00138230 [Tetrahymena thermophila SB210]|eukprot:XP_001019805.1 hypothetical protein TTHERM_00138230 [Tetrahymena thermophila SB210]
MKYITISFIIILGIVIAQDAADQCRSEIQKKIQQNQVCRQGDTDCLNALRSLQVCIIYCSDNSDNQPFTINSICVHQNCNSKNPTAQSVLNDLINCESNINPNPSSSNSEIIAFSIICIFISIIC